MLQDRNTKHVKQFYKNTVQLDSTETHTQRLRTLRVKSLRPKVKSKNAKLCCHICAAVQTDQRCHDEFQEPATNQPDQRGPVRLKKPANGQPDQGCQPQFQESTASQADQGCRHQFQESSASRPDQRRRDQWIQTPSSPKEDAMVDSRKPRLLLLNITFPELSIAETHNKQ